jgi:hypothetical protein
MSENETGKTLVESAIEVHRELGTCRKAFNARTPRPRDAKNRHRNFDAFALRAALLSRILFFPKKAQFQKPL